MGVSAETLGGRNPRSLTPTEESVVNTFLSMTEEGRLVFNMSYLLAEMCSVGVSTVYRALRAGRNTGQIPSGLTLHGWRRQCLERKVPEILQRIEEVSTLGPWGRKEAAARLLGTSVNTVRRVMDTRQEMVIFEG